jgi:CHASE1-domain containing sensor protein
VTTQPEPERDRLARNLSELLQELRVAQAGVQILFGFLLTVVFTQRYESADSLVHGLHLTAVLLAVAAITLLSATASWHRVLFRRSRREKIVRSGN